MAISKETKDFMQDLLEGVYHGDESLDDAIQKLKSIPESTELSFVLSIADYPKLLLAKIDLIKLRHINAGYEWSMISPNGKIELEKALLKLDELISKQF